MRNEVQDEELVSIPLENLPRGLLVRAFQVKATRSEHQKEEEMRLDQSRQVEAQVAKAERDHEHRREEALLEQIHEQQMALQREQRELDKRTMQLDDGRKVYVDGDKFRDEHGVELQGHDRAQAEQLYLEHPDAATWREEQSIQQRMEAANQQAKAAEALRNGPGGPEADKAYAQLQRQVQTNVAKGALPDYGGSDYMAELGGLAASPASKPALRT